MCGSAPSAPQLPQYPGFSPEQQQLLGAQQSSLGQQGQVVSGVSQQLGQNQTILQQVSGLFNSDGSINQTALASLQSSQNQASQTQSQAGQSALNSVNSVYGQGGLNQSATTAYQNALNGNVLANQQLAFTQNQNFQTMKEQAAQQGIQISGDNWQNATSSSTSGQKLLQNYQQNSNIQNNNYQLGYLQQAGSNLQGIANSAATSANTGQNLSAGGINQPLGYLQNSITNGMGALTPQLQSYQQGANNLFQPYQTQQLGQYNQQMAQAQANYQGSMNQYNASQNQMMGWANVGVQLAGDATSAANTYMKTP